ncbi:MAG: UDP-galactopyranose mutase [Clostridiales bacterium]|nr:UDP-galactopyranose mutase [Clostridiales bacterium]
MMKQWKGKPDVIVAGAGFAGAVAAREMAEAGKQVLVLEKRDHIGGNMYEEENEAGIRIHVYGPHIFHTNDEKVFHYIRQFGQWDTYEHRVKGKIKEKEVPIPFNFTSLEALFPMEQAKKLEAKLHRTFSGKTRVTVLELMEHTDQEIAELGQFVFDNVFKGYTAKQWGMPVLQVDRSVISRVPVVLGRDDRYFGDRYQLMPTEGYTKIFENMLRHKNIVCQTGVDVMDLLTLQPDGTMRFDGELFDGIFIYTGMPDVLLQNCFGFLPYRSLRLEFETLQQDDFQSASVVNYPNSEDFTRITEFKKLTGQQKTGVTTILREYPMAFTANAGQEAYYPIENKQNRSLFVVYLFALRYLFWYTDMKDRETALQDLIPLNPVEMPFCKTRQEVGNMSEDKITNGQIQIADEVIGVIAVTAALEVDGVTEGAGSGKGFVEFFGKKSQTKCAKVESDGDEVILDMEIIVNFGTKVQVVAEGRHREGKNRKSGRRRIKKTELYHSCMGVVFVPIVMRKAEEDYEPKKCKKKCLCTVVPDGIQCSGRTGTDDRSVFCGTG